MELRVTVEVWSQELVALVEVKLKLLTKTAPTLLLAMVLEQDPLCKLVIVTVREPAEVNPVAVNVPVPAVVTVMVAVKPVAAGALRL